MTEAIFHIGMGKTGSTALQMALAAGKERLSEQGVSYQGMWLEPLGPERNARSFAAFTQLPPDALRQQGQKLAELLQSFEAKGDGPRFLFSNEAYFNLFHRLEPFFAEIAAHIPVRFIAYLRPVGTWLPSACTQWGTFHKTNHGPIQSLEDTGRRLIHYYDDILRWQDRFGDVLSIRQYSSGIDVVGDFSAVLGAQIPVLSARHQERPPLSAQVLRASFNDLYREPVPPWRYDRLVGERREGHALPGALSDKLDYLFDYESLQPVISEAKGKLTEISRRTGVDLLSEPLQQVPDQDRHGVADDIIGQLVDMVMWQSRELRRLGRRVSELERQSQGVREDDD